MTPTLAQVLSTLAHEIRTPLAVSNGYLRLLLEGGLPSATEQHSALERTREALGVISALCEEMGMLGSVSAVHAPRALDGRLPARALLDALAGAMAADAPEWRATVESNQALATDGSDNVARAVATIGRMAFRDAGSEPRVVHGALDGESLVLVIGGRAAAGGLPPGPDAAGAADVPVVRGGFGLALMWAAYVLEQHRVRTWHRANGRGAVGFLFPLVHA